MNLIKNVKLAGMALLACSLLFQTQITRADDHGKRHALSSPFVILLEGVYQPVPLGEGPRHNLGLSQVNLSDGSYLKVGFYDLDSGFPGPKDNVVGTFYTQSVGDLNAYQLPGGSISAQFLWDLSVISSYEESPDGSWTMVGTFELDILEGTGRYRSFAGGHIHMVDVLKYRASDNTQLEHCFCHISKQHDDESDD